MKRKPSLNEKEPLYKVSGFPKTLKQSESSWKASGLAKSIEDPISLSKQMTSLKPQGKNIPKKLAPLQRSSADDCQSCMKKNEYIESLQIEINRLQVFFIYFLTIFDPFLVLNLWNVDLILFL
jgi:hypothetical protein